MKQLLLLTAIFLLGACAKKSEGNSLSSLYEQGCSDMEAGRGDDAMRAFSQVVETAPATHELAMRATDKMGQLYLQNGKNEDALEAFRRTFDLATIARDTTTMVLALRDMSRTLHTPEFLDVALNCLKKAGALAGEARLDSLRQQVGLEMDSVAAAIGNSDGTILKK